MYTRLSKFFPQTMVIFSFSFVITPKSLQAGNAAEA